MKALAQKELRELLWIALAALGCYLALIVSLMGKMLFFLVPRMLDREEVPFISGGFTSGFLLISLLFAAVLGFRQSAWESSRGTYLFLLHRPLRRETIFLTKLAIGSSVLLICASVPIVLYGSWAAKPGNHAGPFEWSMTGSAWLLVLQMPLVYLGAFLSGLRPARWFGTRLLPLAASLALLFLLNLLPLGWGLCLSLALVVGIFLAGNICFAARMREYA